nr:hypothetical protein [Tanacetum cinerariifolium]
MYMYALTVSVMEPRNVKEAMNDPTWIESMQEELLQFKRLDVWVLIPASDNIKSLTLKWLFKNKHDKENTIIQNKICLVMRGIFLAYVVPKSFIMFQMDMKIAFLHGTLKEDMYVCQPEGIIDPTLFIRRFDDDILVVQVNQSPRGIFINQSNYVFKILKKYKMETCDPVGTLMEIKDKLDLDLNGTLVEAMKYHSMIGALMYHTSSRLNIVHATCLCARYHAKPTEKPLKDIKRIFRYLQGTNNKGLWYTKDSGFQLTGFSNADYAGCRDTFKSTSGGA